MARLIIALLVLGLSFHAGWTMSDQNRAKMLAAIPSADVAGAPRVSSVRLNTFGFERVSPFALTPLGQEAPFAFDPHALVTVCRIDLRRFPARIEAIKGGEVAQLSLYAWSPRPLFTSDLSIASSDTRGVIIARPGQSVPKQAVGMDVQAPLKVLTVDTYRAFAVISRLADSDQARETAAQRATGDLCEPIKPQT